MEDESTEPGTRILMVDYEILVAGLPELRDYAPPRVGPRIDHVISFLDPGYAADDHFETLAGVERSEFRFHDVIEPGDDTILPARDAIAALLAVGETLRVTAPTAVLVHCHAGISRSTAAAAILMAQFNPGREAEVVDRLTAIRPQAWPNSRMIRFADELLGRDGALLAAIETIYRRAATDRPDLVAALRRFGRGAEVPADVD
jgi:predicted protein tyrosine phosphatase